MMKHLLTSFLVALVGIISWALVDVICNRVFTADTHTATIATFMGMWWGVYMGLRWEKKEDVST